MKRISIFCAILSAAAGATVAQSNPSDAQIRAAIVSVFVQSDCRLSGASLSEIETSFSTALAAALGVPVARLDDREGPLFDRSDDMVEDMMEEGLITVDETTPAVSFPNCDKS